MIIDMVRSPRAYFEERIKYPRLRWQSVIVILAGVAANIWYFTLLDVLGAGSALIEDVLLILPFFGIVEYYLWWWLLTGLMQFVASMLGGETSYIRLLRLTGYGFLPMIIAGLVWSAGYTIAFDNPIPPERPEVNSFPSKYAEYTKFMEQFAGNVNIIAGLVVGSIFVLVSGYLWMRAITVATDLDDDRAGIAAGVAVLVLLVRVFFPVV